MKVDILFEGKVIGCADLEPIDPPMGVAAGPFIPTADYDRSLHAWQIDGADNTLPDTMSLAASSAEHGLLQCEGIGIEDYHDSLQERVVTLLGIVHPDYDTAFGSHAMYRAYWQG